MLNYKDSIKILTALRSRELNWGILLGLDKSIAYARFGHNKARI